MAQRRPRGSRGMRFVAAVTKDIRDRLYGGPGAPWGAPNKSLWMKKVDDSLRFSKFSVTELKAWTDEYVEELGVCEHPPSTNHPHDLALMEHWRRWCIDRYGTVERLSSFAEAPGYVSRGVGVKTVTHAINDHEDARQLAEARREREEGS